MTKHNKQEVSLIRIREVMRRTGLSKSYIYQLCTQGKFPQRVHLFKDGSSVAWIESEVSEWINERILQRVEG